jgi:transketolase
MVIVAPCDPLETEAATLACARRKGPTYLRLGKAGEPVLTADAPDPFVLGKVRFIRPGTDVCILSYGPIMKMALETAASLESASGCSVAVASAHTLKPLDVAGLVEIMQRFESVVVIEEHSERASLGAQLKQLAWDHQATCSLTTFSLKDEFIHEFGTTRDLWRAHGLSGPVICEQVAATLAQRRSSGHGRNQPHGSVPADQAKYRRAG